MLLKVRGGLAGSVSTPRCSHRTHHARKVISEIDGLRGIFEREGVLTVADAECRRFSRYAFAQLLKEGLLMLVSRGVYSHADARDDEL